MINKIVELFSSLRFWKLIIAAVIFYLGSQGIIQAELANTIASFLGISIVVRTADKFSK